jgi:hypothetical protein
MRCYWSSWNHYGTGPFAMTELSIEKKEAKSQIRVYPTKKE